MPTFEHVRISLARSEAGPLLQAASVKEQVPPRRAYLSRAFAEQRDFLYGRRKFSFVPMTAPPRFAAGFFGRQVTLKGKAGPEKKFEPALYPSWDCAFFAIDLAEDSQIALMQHNFSVGSPKPILESFLDTLHKIDGFRDYEPHVHYISSEETYLTTVKKYKGRITRIDFTFIPPNALKSKERIMDFIREASEAAKSDVLRHTYESETGKLDPDSPILTDSAEIALQGGGEAKVRADGRNVFSSSSARLKTEVPASSIPTPEIPGLVGLFLSRIFGDRE